MNAAINWRLKYNTTNGIWLIFSIAQGKYHLNARHRNSYTRYLYGSPVVHRAAWPNLFRSPVDMDNSRNLPMQTGSIHCYLDIGYHPGSRLAVHLMIVISPEICVQTVLFGLYARRTRAFAWPACLHLPACLPAVHANDNGAMYVIQQQKDMRFIPSAWIRSLDYEDWNESMKKPKCEFDWASYSTIDN